MHDRDAGRPGGVEQFADVRNSLAAGLFGEQGEARLRPDHPALALLGHERGSSGFEQVLKAWLRHENTRYRVPQRDFQ